MPSVPPNGSPESSATAWSASGGAILWNSGAWDITLPLTAGDALSSVAVVVRDNGASNGHAADGNNVIANLQSRVSGGSVVNLGFFTSTGSGLQQTLNIVLSTPHSLVANETVWLQMIPLTGGALPHVATADSWVGDATVTPPAPTQLNLAQTFNVPLQIFTGFNWSAMLNSTPSQQTYLASAGAGAAYLWIPSQPGRSLTSVTLAAEAPSGGSFISIRVMRFFRDDTGADSIGTLIPVPGPTAAWSDITIPTLTTPSTPDFDVALKLDAATGGLRVKNVRAVWR